MRWVLNTYRVAQDWDVPTIIDMCRKTGHEGIEFLFDFNQKHGIEDHVSPEYVAGVAKQVEDAGLWVASLTSCSKFDDTDPAKLEENKGKAKRTIDLAAHIGCKHVRVLGDRIGDRRAPEKTIDQVAAALSELGAYAAPSGITVSMEMHGHFIDPDLSLAVMRKVSAANVGLVFNCVWPVGAAEGWSLPAGTKSIKSIYEKTGKYWTAVHTHAFERPNETDFYLEMFELLKKDGFKGFISNECAYVGPDPERVLSLYTAFFRAATR